MHVRCPHCQNPIELVEESKLSDVSCPSCGSIFSLLADVETLTHAGINERTIGHFQLIEQVGIGAFGSVWKARDTELDRTVAIKIPRKGQLDASETEQFLREARSAAQLKHPGIVAVHEVGREDGQVYIVSDFIQGINLKNWLSQQRLTSREAAEMCVKIAEALHHAHEQGVIHRDVKPGNIVLDVNNEPHVMDFGLAKREAGEITMTIDGQVLGTPAYMSPEQARGGGHQADRRTDIYSLGVILYELLTGELPFRGDREMLIYQILRDQPIPPRRINSHLPRDLETICLKCLRKELHRRYATAEELGRDLKRWLNSEPIVARPVSRIEKAWLWCCRNRAISGSTGAICVAAAIMVFILIAHRIENDRKRAEFLVDAVLSAPAEAVPYAIQNLEPLREHAIPILQKRFEDDATEPAHRLHAAVALAEFGLVREKFLQSSISKAPFGECANIVAALSHSRSSAIKTLRERATLADANQQWRYKARLAIISLHLGEPGHAQDMLKLRPDPIQRSVLIDSIPTWHGSPAQFLAVDDVLEDAAYRSGACLGIGSIPVDDLSPDDLKACQPILLDWYQHQADSGTHSAAGWALRQWKQTLPETDLSRQLIEGRDWYINSVGMTMLKIPAGSFVRQTPNPNDSPRRVEQDQTVILTRSIWFSDREVSRALFQQFLDDPSCPNEEKPKAWKGASHERSPTSEHPVHGASWIDSVLFCNWLSQKERLTPCYAGNGSKWELIPNADGYRLPYEAEWEHAGRAGTATRYASGDDESLLSRYAVCLTNHTEICGNKMSNGWGVFDVHGNVYEWCQDWYGSYGREGVLRNPTGPGQGIERVLRGGAFNYVSTYASSEIRAKNRPAYRSITIGIRVARSHRDFNGEN